MTAYQSENEFAVGKSLYGGKSRVFDHPPTVQRACEVVHPEQLLELPIQTYIDSDSGRHTTEVDGYKAIVRSDGRQISVQKESYELVHPQEAFSRFAPFVDRDLVTLECGGLLNGGKRMWFSGKLNGAEADVLPGDSVRGNMLFFTSFDGSLQTGLRTGTDRPFCANQIAAMSKNGGVLQFKTKHTKNVRDRLDEYMRQFQCALEGFRESVELYQAIARKPMNYRSQVDYIAEVFAKDIPEEEYSGKLKAKIERVVELIDTQKGLDLVPAARGTAWQAYNAVTEYLTHEHGRNEETRANSLMFGESARTNRQALELALAV